MDENNITYSTPEQEPQPIKYYELLKTLNLAEMIEGGVRQYLWLPQKDGTVKPNAQFNLNSPWEHIKTEESGECEKWHLFMVGTAGNKVASKFIPTYCQSCWKVVVKPRTLEELFAIRTLMIELNWHSKLGIEKRAYTAGLYGAYFYNPTFEEGLNCYNVVRKMVDDNLGSDVSVIYKRGCTEYEARLGDSKYYTAPAWQLQIEKLVNMNVVVPQEDCSLQPKWIIANVHKHWIDFAYTNGDETWRLFADGQPSFVAGYLKRMRPYRTYHHLADCSQVQIENFWNTKDTVEEPYNPKEN